MQYTFALIANVLARIFSRNAVSARQQQYFRFGAANEARAARPHNEHCSAF